MWKNMIKEELPLLKSIFLLQLVYSWWNKCSTLQYDLALEIPDYNLNLLIAMV